ncbi:MAG: hypothetical protein H6560_20725 [Lewinellaceae bacterium]|nr:hypothetical protein [Lewinellaceae bacterium]
MEEAYAGMLPWTLYRMGQYEQYLEGLSITKYLSGQSRGLLGSLDTTKGVFYTPNFKLLIYDEKTGICEFFRYRYST